MADSLTILGIAGSLRAASWNKGTLRAAQSVCPAGAKVEVCDLAGIPAFNQDEESRPPQKVVDFKARIRAADAILIATPEYNYGMPGVLKNAIDWASRPYGDNAWSGKPVALMSAAMSGGGGVRAQYQLRQAFVFLNMDAVVQPEVAIPMAHERFDADGNLKDDMAKKLIAQLLENLVARTRLLRQQPLRAAA
ncbi:MAG: NADPH-dependent FMN reductase [Clostridia bacterium]